MDMSNLSFSNCSQDGLLNCFAAQVELLPKLQLERRAGAKAHAPTGRREAGSSGEQL